MGRPIIEENMSDESRGDTSESEAREGNDVIQLRKIEPYKRVSILKNGGENQNSLKVIRGGLSPWSSSKNVGNHK